MADSISSCCWAIKARIMKQRRDVAVSGRWQTDRQAAARGEEKEVSSNSQGGARVWSST